MHVDGSGDEHLRTGKKISLDQGFTVLNGAAIRSAGANSWNSAIGTGHPKEKIMVLLSHSIHGTGIFTYIYHKNQPNVGKYIIHGSYGYGFIVIF